MDDLPEHAVVVLYDGDCGFCRVVLAILLTWDRAHRLRPVPIESPRGEKFLAGLPHRDRLRSWHLIDAEGTLYSGGAGLAVIFDALPWGTPIARIASWLPGTTSRSYVWLANHRMLLGRLCTTRLRTWAKRVIAERCRSYR